MLFFEIFTLNFLSSFLTVYGCFEVITGRGVSSQKWHKKSDREGGWRKIQCHDDRLNGQPLIYFNKSQHPFGRDAAQRRIRPYSRRVASSKVFFPPSLGLFPPFWGFSIPQNEGRGEGLLSPDWINVGGSLVTTKAPLCGGLGHFIFDFHWHIEKMPCGAKNFVNIYI